MQRGQVDVPMIFFLMYVEKGFISIRRRVKITRVSGSFIVSIYLLRSNVHFKLFSKGFAFCTVFWPCFSASSLSCHFGSRFLVTTWSQILHLLQTGEEIWAQLCSCPECWVHTVYCWWSWPKHMFTGCPLGMKWMIMQTFYWVGPQPGESYAELWKWMSYKLLATFRSVSFSVGLNLQRHEILKSKIASPLQPQTLSGKFPSHTIPGFAKPKQYTRIHIRASVLSILCHDRHWPWRNSDLCDTAKCYSTMFIFMYDHPLWWKSNYNPQE